ncbi:hypothetical protein JXB02_01315 [Candidatus Woesearchaeota archaeon]|nr:hypothetical protein [Candidatus Woesearchaeota archaeon]
MEEDRRIIGFIKKAQGLEPSIAPLGREFEEALARDNPHLNILPIVQSYRRYGYGLLDFMTKRFVHEWFRDFSAGDLFGTVQAKMTNSGMASIDLALTTTGLRRIIAPKEIYQCSDDLIRSYEGTLFASSERFGSMDELERLVSDSAQDALVFLEYCSNSKDLTVWREDAIIRLATRAGQVIVDGTMIGAGRIDPKIFREGNVIYVESLSKNYHEEGSSRMTAGLTVYPTSMEEGIRQRYQSAGSYLQLAALAGFPFDLYAVGKERTFAIARQVRSFYEAALPICEEKGIWVSGIDEAIERTPLVLYLDFHDKVRAEAYIASSGAPQRGSFGHDGTYLLPLGLMWEDAPDGLVRIAFGKGGYPNSMLKALGEAGGG